MNADDVARGRPQRHEQSEDRPETGAGPVRLGLRDQRPHEAPRSTRARSPGPGRRPAAVASRPEQAEGGDEHDERRGDGEQAVVGQRRREVGEVVALELDPRALEHGDERGRGAGLPGCRARRRGGVTGLLGVAALLGVSGRGCGRGRLAGAMTLAYPVGGTAAPDGTGSSRSAGAMAAWGAGLGTSPPGPRPSTTGADHESRRDRRETTMVDERPTVIAGRYRLMNRIGSGGMGHVWLGLGRAARAAPWPSSSCTPPSASPRPRLASPTIAPCGRPASRPACTTRTPSRLRRRRPRRPALPRHAVPPVAQPARRAGRARPPAGARGRPARRRAGARPSPPPTAPTSCTATSSPATCSSPTTARPASPTSASRTPSGDASLTSTGMVTGTPAYLAPEVARGAPSSPASDVFSLGATLYAAVEGAPPFGTGDNADGAAAPGRLRLDHPARSTGRCPGPARDARRVPRRTVPRCRRSPTELAEVAAGRRARGAMAASPDGRPGPHPRSFPSAEPVPPPPRAAAATAAAAPRRGRSRPSPGTAATSRLAPTGAAAPAASRARPSAVRVPRGRRADRDAATPARAPRRPRAGVRWPRRDREEAPGRRRSVVAAGRCPPRARRHRPRSSGRCRATTPAGGSRRSVAAPAPSTRHREATRRRPRRRSRAEQRPPPRRAAPPSTRHDPADARPARRPTPTPTTDPPGRSAADLAPVRCGDYYALLPATPTPGGHA